MDTPTPEAAFDAPWHGQAFALAVALSRAGHFSWPEWTQVFSKTLKDMGAHKELDGSEDYYVAWITALETILTQKDVVLPEAMAAMKSSWSDAYLSTPHGKPVIPAPLD